MVWNNYKVVGCTSTASGTFGIVSEIYESPSVDKDQNWLIVTKYVGYSMSILLLLVFCTMVLLSKHLWEMCNLFYLKQRQIIYSGFILRFLEVSKL